jgi:signal transduction histidine kinase
MQTQVFASLRSRLLLLIALAVLPALGLIFYVNVEQRRQAATQVQDNALRFARLAAAEQTQLVRGTHQLLAALAYLPAVRNENSTECSTLFATLLKHYPAYANLGASRLNGEPFCSAVPVTSSQSVTNASQVWFQRTVSTKEFTVGEYQKSLATGNFTLVLGYPILNEANQVRGVVGAALDLGRLNRIAAQAQLPPGATLTAIDRNGTIIARYPDPERWLGQKLAEAPPIKTLLTQREGVAELTGLDGIRRLSAFAQPHDAADLGLYVSIGIPTEVAFAPARQRLIRNLITVGLISLFMVITAWIGSDVLVLRPVKALVRATQRLRAGDLAARTEISPGPGELNQLAAAFDDMAEALAQHEAERARTEATLQRLSRSLLEAQESERRAVARELHDELGQSLQAIKINLQTAQRFPQEGAARLAESVGLVDHTIQQVRALSVDLRPSLLDDLGLVAALEWYVERQAQRLGFVGRFVAEPHALRLDPTVETACFRIVQEALTNVARHAKATRVWVDLRQQGEELHLVIRDDGVGCDVRAMQERAIQGASFGLLGMRERAELAGGTFTMHSAPAQGTEIRLCFPLRSVVPTNPEAPALAPRVTA